MDGNTVDDRNRVKDLSASINHAVFDIVSGVTVSGTTNVPRGLYQLPQKERDYNASRLLIERNAQIKLAEPELTKAVHRLLESPDSSEQLKAGNIIIVMNSNFYASTLVGDVNQPNITFIQEWNQVKNEIDLNHLRSELEKAINFMQKSDKGCNYFTDLANIIFARDELMKADGPNMLRYLRKVGEFGLDVIKDTCSSILVTLITGK